MKTIDHVTRRSHGRSIRRTLLTVLSVSLLLLLTGCPDDGSDGNPGPAGTPADPPPTDSNLTKFDDPPGVNPVITDVSGGTGVNGNHMPGDMLTVHFTLTKDGGQPWDITELASDSIFVSGPTVNYNRVIGRKFDLDSASVYLGDGMYTYTFADPIPDEYIEPENNDGPYDVDAGELAGQPLLAGTYTVGLHIRFNYTVDGNGHRDAGDAVFDFLIGNTTTIEPHEVVTYANCNTCHVKLAAHGGQRFQPKLCALCHVTGEVDESVDEVSVDWKVMIHKIHNAGNLPSVLGVATNPDGSRDYAATKIPYILDGFFTVDFSHVKFPVWPNLSYAMPEDLGYTALTDDEQDLEDLMREGVTACAKCHGDPDGAGPLPAPADGDLAYEAPSIKACGSCHDDIDWTRPYVSNYPPDGMEVDDYDEACNSCHADASSPFMDPPDPLAVRDAHLHPVQQSSGNLPGGVTPFNPGLNFIIEDIGPAGGSGELLTGDRVEVTFRLENDDGTPVDPATLGTDINAVMAGPNNNSNVLLYNSFHRNGITGAGPSYTINLPEAVWFDNVGEGSNTADETFGTARTPHWDDRNEATRVRLVTGMAGGSTTLDEDAPARQNFLDVDDATDFDADDFIVIDEGGGNEEYMRVQSVDGDRLWFASLYQSNDPGDDYSPSLRLSHDAGESVEEVTVTDELVNPDDFTVNATTGEITEDANDLGTDQPILVTYMTDFLLPSVFEGAFNDSPDLDEVAGEWSGKTLPDGTYRIVMWCRLNLTWTVPTMGGVPAESTSYRAVSPGVAANVRVGSDDDLEPYDLIDSIDNCYACHDDMYFHGNGRRGVETCLVCHATAGAEDHPMYRNDAALPTTGVSVTFREMLHKIHMGKELTNASTYTVIGFNANPHTYEFVGFPAMPEGTKNCTACHGEDNEAWLEPADRDHPTDQTLPVREWLAVCSSCHDSDVAAAHFETQTAAGVEACSVCHGEGMEFGIEVMHKPR